MSIDPHKDMEIGKSISKLSGLLVIALILGAVCIFGITGDCGTPRCQNRIYLAYFAIPFCGGFALVFFIRLLFGPRVPVTLSPSGFTYRYAFKGEIAWTDIARVSALSARANCSLAIHLNVAAAPVDYSVWGRTVKALNFRWSKHVVDLTCNDLDISFPRLKRAFRLYLTEHNPDADVRL